MNIPPERAAVKRAKTFKEKRSIYTYYDIDP